MAKSKGSSSGLGEFEDLIREAAVQMRLTQRSPDMKERLLCALTYFVDGRLGLVAPSVLRTEAEIRTAHGRTYAAVDTNLLGVLCSSVDVLEASARPRTIMAREGLTLIGELVQLTDDALMARAVDPKTRKELRELLQPFGFFFGMTSSSHPLIRQFNILHAPSVETSEQLVADRGLFEQFCMPIRNAGLTTRPLHALVNSRIDYFGDLVQRSLREIGGMKNCGRKSQQEIKDVVTQADLSFDMRPEDCPALAAFNYWRTQQPSAF